MLLAWSSHTGYWPWRRKLDDLVSLLRPLGPASLDVVEHDFVGAGTWDPSSIPAAVYLPATEGLCHLVVAMLLKGCDPQWPIYFTANDLTNMARAAPLLTLTIAGNPDISWVDVLITEGVKAKFDLIRPVRVTRDRPLSLTVVATGAGHFEMVLHYFPMPISRGDDLIAAAERGVAEFIRGGS